MAPALTPATTTGVTVATVIPTATVCEYDPFWVAVEVTNQGSTPTTVRIPDDPLQIERFDPLAQEWRNVNDMFPDNEFKCFFGGTRLVVLRAGESLWLLQSDSPYRFQQPSLVRIRGNAEDPLSSGSVASAWLEVTVAPHAFNAKVFGGSAPEHEVLRRAYPWVISVDTLMRGFYAWNAVPEAWLHEVIAGCTAISTSSASDTIRMASGIVQAWAWRALALLAENTERQRLLARALETIERVSTEDYVGPCGGYASYALVCRATILCDLGRREDARAVVEEIKTRFPAEHMMLRNTMVVRQLAPQ